MPLTRRTFLHGTAAAAGTALLTASPALAQTGTRIFDLYRGKSKIGRQTLTVTRVGNAVSVDVDIDIAVRILGLPAYRYRLESREQWANGVLQRLDSKGNDNGTATRVSALRSASGLQVDGSAWSGTLDGNPGTTTYWVEDFLQRRQWVSTQEGFPMSISATRGGAVTVPTPSGEVSATRWKIRGDIGKLDLFYDSRGEWIGNEFEARGETARFVLARDGGNIGALWVPA